MRSTVKILAIIGAILSLPLVIFGWGLLITIPLIILAVALDRKPTAINNSSKKWALIAIAVGFAIFFGVYILGSLGNLDTTGKPDNVILVIGIIAGLISMVGVYKLGNRGGDTLPPAQF
jgi:glycerol uptake facilitator-like aquaporin